MTMYRKTALVSAEQFLPSEGKIPEGVFSDGLSDPRKSPAEWCLQTLEGRHTLRNGDYICTGPTGEKWNVEQSIFEATYEPASLRTPAPDSWRPIETAPKDRSWVIAMVSGADDRWEHLNGRAFVIRHDGADDGYDMGWALYPGLGGIPDSWFSGWLPLRPQTAESGK